MFLRDKDWAQVVKTNHFSRITILLWGTFREREKRVSAQAKTISEVVKDFEQSLETLGPPQDGSTWRAPERPSEPLAWSSGRALLRTNYWPQSENPPSKRGHESRRSWVF